MSISFAKNPFHKNESIDDSVKRFARNCHQLTDLPTIPSFFENREIFITGSSSYLGKALIEKILRSCPKVGKFFLLMRPSGDDTALEKFCKIKNSSVFDLVREIDPQYQRKFHLIEGDLSQPKLGLSTASKLKLVKVSVIFHIGAANFGDNLKTSILTTTRGTRELLDLAALMKNVKLFCHVSSVLSGLSDSSDTINEDAPAPTHNWREIVKICENTSDKSLDSLEEFCTGFLGNHSFSKNLAENVVKEYSSRLSVLIVRPAMILFPFKEPIPGDILI